MPRFLADESCDFAVVRGLHGCYNLAVKSKLSDLNPYLRDPAKRERAVLKSVTSSSAIEGIRVSLKARLNGPGKPASSKARVKP
ncbi:MAG: hypothetical protein ACT4PQ_13305 [Betaproteobacteria bacterium]